MAEPDYKARYIEVMQNFFPLLMVANAAKSYIDSPDVPGFETLRSMVEAATASGLFDTKAPSGQMEMFDGTRST